MIKKPTKPYPLILKMYGKFYKLESVFGKHYLRECDKNGKVKRVAKPKCKIIPFKKS